MFEVLITLIILGFVFYLLRLSFWTKAAAPRPFVTWLGFFFLIFVLLVVFIDPSNQGVGVFWGILTFPLKPLGLSLLLLSYALSWTYPVFWWGRRAGAVSRGVPQILTAFMILFFASLPIMAYLLTAQTEQRTALELSQRPAANVEAIVVLGEGILPTDPAYRLRTPLGNPASGLSVSLESRLTYATRLYTDQIEQGNTPKIIVSAGPQAVLGTRGTTFANAVNAHLGRLGIPAEQIEIDEDGFDPRSSAVEVRKILLGPAAVPDCSVFAVCDDGRVDQVPSQRGPAVVVPIILITPAVTVRRAVSTFTDLNFSVTARPTDFYVFQTQGGLRLAAIADLIPNADALAITTRAIDEFLAWIYYYLRGWLSNPLGLPS